MSRFHVVADGRQALVLAAALACTQIAVACAPATVPEPAGTPTPIDVSTTLMSEKGLYRITLEPDVDPIPLNEIHTWTIQVRDEQGGDVDGARVTFDGEMPAHQHGLPTVPEVGEGLGEGRYPVLGMKLQMGGHWVLHVGVAAAQGEDRASFNIVLP